MQSGLGGLLLLLKGGGGHVGGDELTARGRQQLNVIAGAGRQRQRDRDELLQPVADRHRDEQVLYGDGGARRCSDVLFYICCVIL